MPAIIYAVDGEDIDNGYKLITTFAEEDPAWMIAEQAAEDYHANHDGWEDYCPLEFSIWLEDGTPLGTFSIELEAVPTFSASAV
jgi:hypothetical protein